jgi:hypothetical protein
MKMPEVPALSDAEDTLGRAAGDRGALLVGPRPGIEIDEPGAKGGRILHRAQQVQLSLVIRHDIQAVGYARERIGGCCPVRLSTA